jgi:circadian clock protein KaiC
MRTPVDVTYLSDTIILLRYFEAAGEVRRAISVIKKRAGGHERTIRELQIDQYGIAVGGALNRFQGVLRGVPSFIGEPASLLGADPA